MKIKYDKRGGKYVVFGGHKSTLLCRQLAFYVIKSEKCEF